jgi:formate-dependent nitrite reductase membrane component NrfD
MQLSEARYIDPALGTLEGEASHQQVEHREIQLQPWRQPTGLSPQPTYYDKPAIKPPVWIWSIPTYFYVGGVAGAAMVMGMAAQVFGGNRLRSFDERCRWVGAIGGGIGSALLIHDLGRKTRFLFMLRVFRPTSPMSIGSWVLAAATPLSAGSALLTAGGRGRGAGGRLGRAAGIGAGLLGLPLATYTGVLISNTAVPLWCEGRRVLPILFGASSVASMGALSEFMNLKPYERRIMEQFAFAGRIAELGAGWMLEREVARVDGLAKPFQQGVSGALWKTAKLLTAASLVVSLLPGKWKGRLVIAGTLGTLGGLAVRFAIFQAGKASANDPQATFRQQRAASRTLPQPKTVEEVVNI